MKKNKKILILGSSGMIGKDLYNLFQSDFFVSGTYLKDEHVSSGKYKLNMLDILAADNLIEEIHPDLIINAIGIPSPEICEEDKKKAYLTNYRVAQNLSYICKEKKISFIYFSTDYIFSGSKKGYTEKDIPNPINYYGLTKLLGEVASEKGLILRLPKIIFLQKNIDPFFQNFTKGKIFSLDNTRPRRFLWTYDLYKAIKIFDELNITKGVYNVCGDDIFTKYKLANLYLEASGIKLEVKPSQKRDLVLRPDSSVLNNNKIKKLGMKFTPIADIFRSKLFNS
jgi:dTDP-4-dehydrorhamnose reductase